MKAVVYSSGKSLSVRGLQQERLVNSQYINCAGAQGGFSQNDKVLF